MAGQATQSLELRYHRLEVFNRWMVVVAVVALLAVAGMAAWIAADRFGQPDGEQVATSLAAAWTADTSADLESVYAEDAVLVDSSGTTHLGLDALKRMYSTAKSIDFTPTIIGPVTQSGRTVAVPIRLSMSDGSEYYVTTVLELNSEGLVVHHQDYGAY